MTRSYDLEKYSEQKLPNFMLLHWILNPGLAVNEIFLGQRIPRVMLIDKTSSAPLMRSYYVPCPHCGSVHSSMLWSGANGFGHWFGLICPHCRGKIPCLWNLTSLMILLVSFPIWLPIKMVFEKRYLTYELRRLENAKSMVEALPEVNGKSWIRAGLVFGSMTFLLLFFLLKPITEQNLMLSGVCGLVAGILFPTFLWLGYGRKKSRPAAGRDWQHSS